MRRLSFRSALRDPRLLVPSALVLVASLLLGAALFVRSENTLAENIRQQLQSEVTLAASHIRAGDVLQVQSTGDASKPAYKRMVQSLRDIRDVIPNARFAYIFRKTESIDAVAFVADADATSSVEELDFNKNGKVDPDEVPGLPGELYDVSDQPILQGPAFEAPIVSDVYRDQWGDLLSAFAPIRAADGTVVGILGIDMRADEFVSLTQRAFSPISLILVIFLGSLMALALSVSGWFSRLEFLGRLDRERTQLVRLAMHQFGSPLATMRWWRDLLMEAEPKPMNADRMESYEQMQQAIERMSTLIEELRRATSVYGGDLPYERSTCSMKKMILNAADRTLHLREKKHQTIRIVAEHDMEADVDCSLLTGVIVELLENASVYSEPGTEIEVRLIAKRNEATVEVEDHGIGIPEAEREKIFQEFTRGAAAPKYKAVGNGLGLFIARGVVEMAEGSMHVQSTEGKGSTFSFTLPATKRD